MIHIIGNWKMNKSRIEALDFSKKLSSFITKHNFSNCCISISPSSVHLSSLYHEKLPFDLVAQNISFADFGAYTGEVSAAMVSEYVSYTLIGHSEQRMYFNETNENLYKKIILALKHNLKPIFCFGEQKTDRESGDYLSVIEKQLENTVMLLGGQDFSNIILAYEPVWAIGTGEHALPDQIHEVHAHVRSFISNQIGGLPSVKIPILYGGSCNIQNTKVIISQPHVDGLLIGGASLDVDHFCQIIQVAEVSQSD